MKILQHTRFGPPAEVLELIEETLPPLGDDEVVIRVEAAAIHAGDLYNIEGKKIMVRNVEGGERNETSYDDFEVELPQVPGVEGVGRIAALGANVDEFLVGDRVFLPLQCGAWREELHANAATLIRAPEGDALQLALIVNAMTADIALRELIELQAGDWLIQNAANSNVGRDLIKLAKVRGIRTVNIVRRQSLVDELYELGADVVLLDGPELARRVRQATGDATILLGIDSVAGAAAEELAWCLSDGGMLANMGMMSGAPCTVTTQLLLYKQITLRGFYGGFHIAAMSRDAQRKLWWEMGEMRVQGVLKAQIAGSYPLSEYRDAVIHAAKSGQARDGKIVFDMRQESS